MAEITLKDEVVIIFIITLCVDESDSDIMARLGNWNNILHVKPCCRTLAEVRVNNGKLASWPMLIRAHSGMSGSGDI